MDFEVKGMSCSGCSSSVERAVGAVEGVSSCTVDLEKSRAKVIFDAAIATPQRIVEAIQRIGYDARMMG